jgi:hypothetical protein
MRSTSRIECSPRVRRYVATCERQFSGGEFKTLGGRFWPVSGFVNSTLRSHTVFPKLTSQPRFLIPWARRRSVVFHGVNLRCRPVEMLGNRYAARR